MRKLFLILMGLTLLIPGCDDSGEETDTKYIREYEIKFRDNQFPNTGYTLTTDAYIGSLVPDGINNGSNLTVTEFSTNQRRALIDFRIDGYLPSEAHVTRAVLTFYALTVSPEVAGESIPVYIYPLQKSWTEGQATWEVPYTFGLWDTAGGDYNESELIGTVSLTEDDDFSYIDFELDPAYVQDMIKDHNGTYGFIIKLSDGDQSVIEFYSRQAPGFEPLLTVYYR